MHSQYLLYTYALIKPKAQWVNTYSCSTSKSVRSSLVKQNLNDLWHFWWEVVQNLLGAGSLTSKKSCNMQFHMYESPCWHKCLQLFGSLSSFNTLLYLVTSEYNKPVISHSVPGCRLTRSWVVTTLERNFLMTRLSKAGWTPPNHHMQEWLLRPAHLRENLIKPAASPFARVWT